MVMKIVVLQEMGSRNTSHNVMRNNGGDLFWDAVTSRDGIVCASVFVCFCTCVNMYGSCAVVPEVRQDIRQELQKHTIHFKVNTTSCTQRWWLTFKNYINIYAGKKKFCIQSQIMSLLCIACSDSN